MNENKDIKSLVLEKIQSGKINMRPRFYFVLKVAILILVAVLTLLVSSLLVSFIIFSLMASGMLFLFGFGLRGFLMFFLLFPWPLFVLEVVFIILLEWLVKRFKFGYRLSFSRLLLVILSLSVVIGVIIDITPLHRDFQHRAEQRNLPLVGDFYREIRRPQPNQEIFRGVVSDAGTSSFVLNHKNDGAGSSSQKYFVILPPDVPGFVVPSNGDVVFVAGKLMPDGTAISAYGFQKFSAPDDVE